jgi:hypothetical protein
MQKKNFHTFSSRFPSHVSGSEWRRTGQSNRRRGSCEIASTRANIAASKATGAHEVCAPGDIRNRSEVEVPEFHCLGIAIRYHMLRLGALGEWTNESDFTRMGSVVL